MVNYSLSREGEFVIEDYSRAHPFASFLPGIAGVWGIPMWCFYVNRAQAIAGFGIQDKDHPIMEFQPANRAFRNVSLQGFRTFLKVATSKGELFYEPFQTKPPNEKRVQKMRIRSEDLVIEETHPELGLGIQVHYFTIPNEPFAALARVLTLKNLSRKKRELQLVDGLPAMIPYGMFDWFLKNMSRTIEAWVWVGNFEHKAPFYRLKVEPNDRPEVVPIQKGNFYLGFCQVNHRVKMLEPIADPTILFGSILDLSVPEEFLKRTFRVPRTQLVCEKTPCAMGYLASSLLPTEERTIYSLYGHAESQEELNRHLPRLLDPNFFVEKARQNQKIVQEITQVIATQGGSPFFDLYCRQTFLDNVLRGGKPVHLGKPLYVYSRKHGDLERDYNQFVIPPTHYSQGNANFRDVNQNRRNDVWFYPEIGDQNVITFFNLIQADGFNPLVFKGIRYVLRDLKGVTLSLHPFFSNPFTPGELVKYLKQHPISLNQPLPEFLSRILLKSEAVEEAEHGEGFWTDHWTYNLDLLESYLAIYPEKLREILLEKRAFTFYDNSFVVADRAKKYLVVGNKIRQLGAVYQDPEKSVLIQSRKEYPHQARTDHGKGEIYRTHLLVKMLCVVVNKLASLDPLGMGIEMEADKPNWFDALNGLPGLLGSSLCETFELKRWIKFLIRSLERLKLEDSYRITLPEELNDFLNELSRLLEQNNNSTYWERSYDAKEEYRKRVRFGFSGNEKSVAVQELMAFCHRALAKLDQGLHKAYNSKHGIYPSYFYYEVEPQGQNLWGEWKQHILPPFLEGMVHALRLETQLGKAKKFYHAVRQTELYDKKLKMYRVCADLSKESEEIGRCRVFNPGWLENQSIWLHMEYKYLLELLRAGLYDEFYDDFFKAVIPFQSPKRYRRSILENSSFLVSSVYLDPRLHGAGFVARLSGASAEFLQMWLWMVVGRHPFFIGDKGRLNLRLAPVLSKELFTQDGRFEFCFLGKTQVTYWNPKRLPTFGHSRVTPQKIRLQTLEGDSVEFLSDTIPHPYAEALRQGKILKVEAELRPFPGLLL